jgi:hypothetical protein
MENSSSSFTHILSQVTGYRGWVAVYSRCHISDGALSMHFDTLASAFGATTQIIKEAPQLRECRTHATVVATVQKTFPETTHARVLDLLDSYGVDSYEQGRERVQLAILKLSEGNEEKLREFVSVAKRDYRDVLFWAEYPEEAKLDTPEKREPIKKMFEKFGIKPPEGL